jgi:hypothetical protein
MADQQPAQDKKPFTGSCHCGAIRYTVRLALPTPPVATRCNCTICLKTNYTSLQVPPEDFALESPASEADVRDYQWRSKDAHRFYCDKCGVHVFSRVKYELGGKEVRSFGINIVTLDQPQEGLDLSRFEIRYWDGRSDNWAAGLKEGPYPGGCI